MRPATLDRVENGGPGSDINPHERRPKGANSTTGRSSGPRSSSLPPCSKLYKARPGNGGACLDDGATAGLDSLCARRRPKSTVAAEESLRRGRTKEMTQERKKKRLRLWRRLENQDGHGPPHSILRQSAAVLDVVKTRPGNGGACLDVEATAGLDDICARRRGLSTVGAEECLQRGRTKEWEQRK